MSSLSYITDSLSLSDTRLPGYGVHHNWTKKSIFWELPYWKSNLIRHNIDVMHTEKNFFDNIFNTVMNVHDKTKNNLNVRLDDHIPLIEFAYNNSFQSSIGMAPYEALYGRRCRTPLTWFEVGERRLLGSIYWSLVFRDGDVFGMFLAA